MIGISIEGAAVTTPIEKHARAIRLNVPCPVCAATKGSPCTHPSGDVFPESHRARIAVATEWVTRRRKKSVALRELSGRPSRSEVRSVPCPECGAPAGENCVGTRRNERHANHQARINAFLRKNSG